MPIPTEQQIIAILRKRLTTVEQAAEDFLAVLEETGNKRSAVFHRMDADWEQMNMLPSSVRDFLVSYVATMPPRLKAAQDLKAALTTDFYTALLQCDDVTDEQLAEWFAKQDAEGVPA
jgi:hypothetical protein